MKLARLGLHATLVAGGLWGATLPGCSCAAGADPEDGEGGGGAAEGGSGASSGTFNDGGNNPGFDGEECAASTIANAVPASILVVLDKSGSMAGGDGVPDKWAPTRSALQSAMATAQQDLIVGLMPFPKGDFEWGFAETQCALDPSTPQCEALFADGGCEDVNTSPVVPLGPLSATQGPINSWLNANGPDGGTPTLWALKAAYEHMRGVSAEGERYVLLMTDGEPNTYTPEMTVGPFTFPESNLECKQLPDIVAEASAGASGSPVVKTFVIGSPGSEGASTFLSEVAVAGLTGPAGCQASSGQCHFQIGTANFQADLQAALDVIAGQISECIFALPEGEEVDPNKVNVLVETATGDEEVYQDPSHQDGWDYTDGSKTKIQLFGPACEAFQNTEGNKIEIVLGCETVVK